MALVVLDSRNEPYRGEQKVYLNNFTTSEIQQRFKNCVNPNPSCDSLILNLDTKTHDHTLTTGRHRLELPRHFNCPSEIVAASMLDQRDAMAVVGCDGSSYGGYMTFNFSEYTRRELKFLKKKLVSELEQVRSLKSRIESRKLGSTPAYPGTQFSSSGGYGGVEANHGTRPPPLSASSVQTMVSPPLSVLKKTNLLPSGAMGGKKMKKQSQKKLTGRKRPNSAVSSGGMQRPNMDLTSGKMMTSMKKRCGHILNELMRSKFGWVFNKPVDVAKLGLLDYHRIIKHPMDLGTVKTKLRKGAYDSPHDFAADVRLTFDNAILYNPVGQDVHVMAMEMLSNFNVIHIHLLKKFEEEQRMISVEEHHQLGLKRTSSPASAPAIEDLRRTEIVVQMESSMAPAPIPQVSSKARLTPVKLPKPNAKVPNKREMSYDEKAKLGMNLQNLPDEKMDQLVNIVKRRNGHLVQDGDEIELDIELMDVETLWELDRFVCSVHKMMQQQQEHVISDKQAQKNNKGESGEDDIDIGEEILITQFPPIEIEKDIANPSGKLSCSGSLSSSSSSSGSGSTSSPGSDSDAGSVHSPYFELKEARGF